MHSTNTYPQQIASAKNICSAFATQTRSALLWAKCQSGKTGCYHSLIRRMMRVGMIQHAYIVCGSSETELRNQAIDDVRVHNLAHVDKIKVIFHQDFDKTDLNLTNALVIVDESHLVQTVGQKLHLFLGRHGITMDGNPKTLIAHNAFVLSVDATPYSEMASLTHTETPFKKHVERMLPGEGYRGLDEFRKAGVVHETFSIVDQPERFAALLRPHKYSLIRLNHSKLNDAALVVIRAICAEKGFKVLNYLSGLHEVAITRKEQMASKVPISICLEDEPDVPTVILLCNRLRAGKVVPKRHIGLVWEGAEESNTDVIVQGLLGRMCGYEVCDLPMIFVPAPFLLEMSNMNVRDSEMTRAIAAHDSSEVLRLPRKATNLKPGRLTTAPPGRTACVPICLQWERQMEDVFDATKTPRERLNAYKPEGLELLRRKIRGKLAESKRFTEEQKAEILAFIFSENPSIHGRLFRADSDDTYYCALLKCHANGTSPEEHISEFPTVTIMYTEPGFAGLRRPGANERNMFVVFYTTATGLSSIIPMDHRVAPTTGKSIFSLDTSSVPVTMGGVVGISRENIQNPVKFEAGLRAYMTMVKSGTLVAAREWVPCRETTKLNSTRFHYVSPLDNDVERMCRRLETELGLKKKQIRVKYARSGKTHFNVKKICW